MGREGVAVIRLMLVGCQDLLGDLIRSTIAGQSDMLVVADLAETADPVAELRSARPDVIVWNTADDSFLNQSTEFFTPAPAVRIVATLDDGRRGTLWELRPAHRPVGELTPDALLGTIREAVAR
jgi:hypothetical protein